MIYGHIKGQTKTIIKEDRMSRERVIQQIIQEYDKEVREQIAEMEVCKNEERRNVLATLISTKLADIESLYQHLERIKKAS